MPLSVSLSSGILLQCLRSQVLNIFPSSIFLGGKGDSIIEYAAWNFKNNKWNPNSKCLSISIPRILQMRRNQGSRKLPRGRAKMCNPDIIPFHCRKRANWPSKILRGEPSLWLHCSNSLCWEWKRWGCAPQPMKGGQTDSEDRHSLASCETTKDSRHLSRTL